MGYDNKKTYNSKLYASEWNTLTGDLMNGIEKDIFVPYVSRATEYSNVYSDEDYLVCRSKIEAAAYIVHGTNFIVNFNSSGTPNYEHCSWITLKEYDYGTYEWTGRMSPTDGGETYFGFERRHGWPCEGIICFLVYCEIDGNLTYKTWTSNGNEGDTGNDHQTQTEISNQTWADDEDHNFKLVWLSGNCGFYVDEQLIATHTTHVPSASMGFFGEALSYKYIMAGTVPSVEAKVKFKKNSLEKTA